MAIASSQVIGLRSGRFAFAGSTPNAGDVLARQANLLRDTAQGSLDSASKLSGSTARLARSALKPVHKRVAANVKRLRKASK